jgi:hypothetical protein
MGAFRNSVQQSFRRGRGLLGMSAPGGRPAAVLGALLLLGSTLSVTITLKARDDDGGEDTATTSV